MLHEKITIAHEYQGLVGLSLFVCFFLSLYSRLKHPAFVTLCFHPRLPFAPQQLSPNHTQAMDSPKNATFVQPRPRKRKQRHFTSKETVCVTRHFCEIHVHVLSALRCSDRDSISGSEVVRTSFVHHTCSPPLIADIILLRSLFSFQTGRDTAESSRGRNVKTPRKHNHNRRGRTDEAIFVRPSAPHNSTQWLLFYHTNHAKKHSRTVTPAPDPACCECMMLGAICRSCQDRCNGSGNLPNPPFEDDEHGSLSLSDGLTSEEEDAIQDLAEARLRTRTEDFSYPHPISPTLAQSHLLSTDGEDVQWAR